MAADSEEEECVRFGPLAVEGLPDVSEVAVYSNRVEVRTAATGWTAFRFDSIARRQENAFIRWLKRLVGITPFPFVVGEREFCTKNRYVVFYTEPKLKVFTPPDADAPYGETYICRINVLLGKGGYCTSDFS